MTPQRETLFRLALSGVVIASIFCVSLLKITGPSSPVSVEVQDGLIAVALILWPGQYLLTLSDSGHPRSLMAAMPFLILAVLTNAPLYTFYGIVYRRIFRRN